VIKMIEDLIEPYYIDLEMKGLSKATVRGYISEISSFLSYLDKEKITPKFENVSGAVVAQYLDQLRSKGYANATIAKKANWLKYFFAYCVNKGVIPSNPVKRRMIPKVIHITPEYLTDDEINALLKAADAETNPYRTRDKALILLMLNMVIRPREAVCLNWNDIDFANNTIMIIRKKTPGIKVVPMNEELKKALLDHREASLPKGQEALFQNKYGQRLQTVSVNRIIRETARKAGIEKKVSWFTLRRAPMWQRMKRESNPHDMQKFLFNEHNTFITTASNNLCLDGQEHIKENQEA